ncbi:MAG: FtsQ-type POTRA domain-containing protein [Deltaproteobacteria bacterium]|nr:MAG: FtsQ-type POTRA domain-containing protein [Deltaproteobacteria bacterium]
MSNRRRGQARADLMGLRGLLAAAGTRLSGLKRVLRRGGNRRVGRHQDAPILGDVGAQARAAARGESSAQRRASAVGGLKGALATTLGWAVPVVVAVGAFATPMLGVRAYHYVMTSGHFNVHEILVEGNRRLSYDAIREALEVEPDTQLLATDLDAMQERCEAQAWVSWCRVRRELPDRLVVELVEHEPAAWLALGELTLVDSAGAVFATAAAADAVGASALDLPIITGIAADALATPAGRAETESRLRGVLNVLELYRSMGLAGRWPVGEVRVDTLRGLTLVISPMGTEAVLGQGPYRDKLFRLEWVLESLRQEGRTAEYVVLDAFDIDGDGDGRVVVKADLPPAGEALMEQAAERAREAQRKVLGLPPDPNIFGPAIVPAPRPRSGDDGDDAATETDEGPARPTLTGGRPAVGPDELNTEDGEEE